MLRIVFILLLLPVLSHAQINRSAKELAQENIEEYLSKKIFKNQPFQSGTIGELVSYRLNGAGISWKVQYQVDLKENQPEADSTRKVPSKFTFYLDREFVVLLADRWFKNF
jgi:hypothetical protein